MISERNTGKFFRLAIKSKEISGTLCERVNLLDCRVSFCCCRVQTMELRDMITRNPAHLLKYKKAFESARRVRKIQ